jgi:hypothetical protein
MYNIIDYEMLENCDECISGRAVVRVKYSRGESETLCQRCYITFLRDIISRYQNRNIMDLVKWVARFTDVEFLNVF